VKDIYTRFQEKGRDDPGGAFLREQLDLGRFRALLPGDGMRGRLALQEWVLAWGDLARFEIVPLVGSKETYEAVKKHL
jgi:hypothetical protein